MFLKKSPAQPCKKNPRPTKPAELHTAISTPPFAFVRPRDRARHETLGSGRGAGRGSGFREAGPCRWVRRRRRRICATCSPGPVSTHRPRVRPAGSHNGSGCRGRPSGLGMHNNSARRGADRAVNRGRRRNVWGTGGRATASGQQSLSATAGFSQTRAPREQGPHELSGLQASMEVVQCGLRREGQRGASCNGRGHAGARCGAGAG
jgi:hypothetical protein